MVLITAFDKYMTEIVIAETMDLIHSFSR